MSTVAIIGAGISGLTCAHYLRHMGHQVTVFEKGRKPGGRCGTRKVSGHTFDHGAQYFTARATPFKLVLEGLRRGRTVEVWDGTFGSLHQGDFVPEQDGPVRYVGTPSMDALPRALGHGTTQVCRTRITGMAPGQGWTLQDATGRKHGPFERAVVALPARASAALLSATPDLAARAASVAMTPCWATMVVPRTELPVAFDAAFVHDSPVLSWVARERTRPGRAPSAAWVLHANTEWSVANMNEPAETVAGAMVRALAEALDAAVPPPAFVGAHLWENAGVSNPLPESHLWDPSMGVGACGDWCGGPRIEGAFLSGLALANAIGGT